MKPSMRTSWFQPTLLAGLLLLSAAAALPACGGSKDKTDAVTAADTDTGSGPNEEINHYPDVDAVATPDTDIAGTPDVDAVAAPDSDVAAVPDADQVTPPDSQNPNDADSGGNPNFYRNEWAVLVRGVLADMIPIPPQMYHDALAARGEQPARDLGDVSHDVLLGKNLMGSPEGQFLALDRWDNTDGMFGFYSNPEFSAAFQQLFDATGPTVEQFQKVDWYSWGNIHAANGAEPHYWVVVRGTLAGDDLAAAQTAHDALAAGGQEAAQAAGDVGHVVYLGLEPAVSDFEFLAIDIWTDATGIEGFYSALPADFMALFATPPTVAVYESSNFYQYDADEYPDPEFAVLVRGTLADQVPVAASMYHDMLAAGGQPAAQAAGDLSHDAMLSTDLFGAPVGTFLGLDRWNDVAAMAGFYQNPDFAAAFAQLFAPGELPMVEQFQSVDWFGWGDVTSGDASDPYYWVIVRGTLADPDLDAAHAAHDALASGGQETSQALGDVAHMAFLGIPGSGNEQELLAIDIWTDPSGIEGFYGALPPDFAALFVTPPVVTVYQSANLHQW